MSAESSAPKSSSLDSKTKSPPSTESVTNLLRSKGEGLSKFRNATKKISHELEYQRLLATLENTKMPALLSKLRDATNKDCTWRTSVDILNICALASLVTPYFDQHSLSVKMELCANMKLETFRKNQYICKQNDVGEDFYIVASGGVEVQVKSQYDEQKIEKLALLKVGSAFGEMALLSEASRCASCMAVRVSDILMIDKATFLKVFEDKQAMFNAEGQAFLKEEVHAFKTATETCAPRPSLLPACLTLLHAQMRSYAGRTLLQPTADAELRLRREGCGHPSRSLSGPDLWRLHLGGGPEHNLGPLPTSSSSLKCDASAFRGRVPADVWFSAAERGCCQKIAVSCPSLLSVSHWCTFPRIMCLTWMT